MCGILGVIDLLGTGAIDEVRFDSALSTLDHRGPDARQRIAVSSRAMLGHTRLSIIDLSSASNQPIVVDGRYWMVYNGEIFNYRELRSELIKSGVTFRTSGDAEVLLKSYIFWGESCVNRFNGMWSFAIFDDKENELFCSRDRFGEKPFNYALLNGKLYFASEIKALLQYEPRLAEPDYNVISNFCRTSVGAQHPETWFKQIRRLQPGHNLLVRNSKVNIRRYWNYPQEKNWDMPFEQARQMYEHLFNDAVRIRMRSDVPLGVTLSSGLDSTSIAYAMQNTNAVPHHCFTARFRPEENLEKSSSIYAASGGTIDESVSALRIARELHLTSHIVDTDYSNFVDNISDIIWHLESGNSSPAVIPLMQLLKAARPHVKVVLEGQGADELLGGYVANVIWQNFIDLALAGKAKEALSSVLEYSKTYKLKYSLLMALRVASNRMQWLSILQQRTTGIAHAFGPALHDYERMSDSPPNTTIKNQDLLTRTLMGQHSGGLVNLLHYGDAISMANSIESRMPFLDHRLVEFVWALPGEFKIKLGVGKYIHRQAMRGLVPDWIIDDKVKLGFNSPISSQFRKEYPAGKAPIDVLMSKTCLDRGLFNKSGLIDLFKQHKKGRRDHATLLFRMLSTELWFRKFIDAA